LTLLQAGTSVTGTLKIGNGKVMQISSGNVSSLTITFAVGAGAGTLSIMNGAQLAGKLTSPKGEIFDMVFTRQ